MNISDLNFEKFAGYFENGSTEQFHLYPDDATRTWHVTRDGKTLGYGSTVLEAMRNAVDNTAEDRIDG